MTSQTTTILAVGLCALVFAVLSTAATIPASDASSGSQNVTISDKSKTTAFCLSFFMGGFAADWWYLALGNGGYIGIGFVKFLITLVQIIGSCVKKAQGDESKPPCIIVVGICTLVMMVWWLADWARILAGSFPDGDGNELGGW